MQPEVHENKNNRQTIRQSGFRYGLFGILIRILGLSIYIPYVKLLNCSNPFPGLQSILLTWIRVTFQIFYKSLKSVSMSAHSVVLYETTDNGSTLTT